MRKTANLAATAASVALLIGSSIVAPGAAQADQHGSDSIKEGKALAVDRKLGNCLACHLLDDGVSPGNIGPPLVAMKARFPKRDRLYTQIYDPMKANPDTRMPPFGKHAILSEGDINKIVDYLYTL